MYHILLYFSNKTKALHVSNFKKIQNLVFNYKTVKLETLFKLIVVQLMKQTKKKVKIGVKNNNLLGV